MPTTQIPLERIERGSLLKELLTWYELTQREFARRFDATRRRTRRAAERAGFTPQSLNRLIAEARTHRRAKT